MIDFLSDLIITKIHSVSTMYSDIDAKTRRWSRQCWALLYKYEGETEYICNGEKMSSNKNCLYLLPKGSAYEWRCTAAGHYHIIEFACEKSYPHILRFPITDGKYFSEAFEKLEHMRTMQKPFYEMESIQALYGILLKLLTTQKNYAPSAKQQKIQSAMDYIATHYAEPLTNDLLAAQTDLSTVYFRKLFYELHGNSPMLYVQKLRIQKAKELLSSDHGGIASVAQSLGYTSIYDFSRSFKKHVGMSPSAYIKNHK